MAEDSRVPLPLGRGFDVRANAPAMFPRCSLALVASLALPALFAACDGTLAGIGHEARAPEAPLAAHDENRVEEPTEIAASHLLVMYAGSRGAPKSVTRTKDEARARAEEARDRAREGEDFGELVAAYTDEPGGAARRGELGRFGRGMMVKPFADAAFALEVGEVSEVVETVFGFHVIQRTQ